jgi:hypothetical protein
MMMFTKVSIPTLVLLLFFTPARSTCPRLEEYRRLWTLGEVQAYNQDHSCCICLFITNATSVYAFDKPNLTTTCDGNEGSDSFCIGKVHYKRWGQSWPVFVPDAWGPRNSQYLMDPFTLTHLHHGTLWYTFTSFLFTQERHLSYVFVLLALIEGIWEYEENSIGMIRRFRSGGLSREYHGDAILNSIGDWLAAIFGFGICWWLQKTYTKQWVRRAAIWSFLISEGMLILYQHDCLILVWLQLLWNPEWLVQFQKKETWASVLFAIKSTKHV